MNAHTYPKPILDDAGLATTQPLRTWLAAQPGTAEASPQDVPPGSKSRRFRLRRTRLSALSIGRAIGGGRIGDFGRTPRYLLVAGLALVAIWVPIVLYVKYAPLRYSSQLSLILPGSGVSTSVNLSDIGQATSSSNSAYASSTISPTVTYQTLLQSRNVIDRAAASLDLTGSSFGSPRVKLLDQTSLISVEMTAATPEVARARAAALLAAFMTELDTLRSDEIAHREASSTETIRQYQGSVDSIRQQISALQMSSGLTSADQYNEIVTATQALKARVVDIEAAAKDHAGAIQSLSSMLRVSPELAARTLKLHADVEFNALAAGAAKDAAALAEFNQLYGPKHPKVVGAAQRYLGSKLRMLQRGSVLTGLPGEQLQAEIDMSSDGQRAPLLARLVTLVSERDGLAAQLASLKAELEADKRRVVDLVGTASKLDSLNRDYKVAEAVFTSALARISTSKADLFASYPMVQVSEAPTLPDAPSSPNKKIAFGAGAAASLFAFVGLFLAWMRRPIIERLVKGRAKGASEDA